MINAANKFLSAFAAAVVGAAVLVYATSGEAQQQPPKPSPAALAVAKEIVVTTGVTNLFNSLIPGVVEQAKLLFLQQNPALSKDLNEVSLNIRNELAPRFDEIVNEVALQYATRFTEQELKDTLALYKSPLGKKLLSEQPKIAEASVRFAQNWANKLSDEVVNKIRDQMKKRGHDL